MSADKAKMPAELERDAFFEKTQMLQKRLEKSLQNCKTITADTKDYIAEPNAEKRTKMQKTPRFGCQR